MKKFISLLLAVTMVFAMGTSVFANSVSAETPNGEVISVTWSGNGHSVFFRVYVNGVHERTVGPTNTNNRYIPAVAGGFNIGIWGQGNRATHVTVNAPINPTPAPSNIVTVQNQNVLRDYLSRFDEVILRTTNGNNLGIFDGIEIPAGTTLIVETPLHVRGSLTINGTLIVADGGRVSNQGNGSAITVASGGVFDVQEGGRVENVIRSIIFNYGTIINAGSIQVRAEVTNNLGNSNVINAGGTLTIHRHANNVY